MATNTPVPTKTRSPNYPAIDLREAVERIKSIYETQRRYPATREVLAKLIGYKSLNGASATMVSALSKYGLIEGHGDSWKVSELGQDLVLHRKGDPEYTTALRTAAFLPTFFKELHDQFPYGLPGEHALRATLMKRGFSSKAIDPAVRAYRDTMEFVDAETAGSGPAVSPDTPLPEAPMQTQSYSADVNWLPTSDERRRESWSLGKGRSAELILSESEFEESDLRAIGMYLNVLAQTMGLDSDFITVKPPTIPKPSDA